MGRSGRGLSVKQLEAGIRAGHEANLAGKPKCGMDKWLDNHFAFDSPDHADSNMGDDLVKYLDSAPDALYGCEQNPRKNGPRGLILHYVVDPTGWGIQYGMPYSIAPAKCASNATLFDLADVHNPACDLGTC